MGWSSVRGGGTLARGGGALTRGGGTLARGGDRLARGGDRLARDEGSMRRGGGSFPRGVWQWGCLWLLSHCSLLWEIVSGGANIAFHLQGRSTIWAARDGARHTHITHSAPL